MPDGRPYLIKLVRDKVGELLAGGGKVSYEPLDDRELHVKLLREKLIEEALEYHKKPSVGEAADVLQALFDLVDLDLRASRADLEEARVDKYNERGGFLEGTAMFVTTLAPPPGEPELVEEFAIGDRIEVLAPSAYAGEQGTFVSVAPAEGDLEGYLVLLDNRGENPLYARYLRLVPDA